MVHGIALVLILFATQALAAQPARVDADGTKIMSGPSKSSQVVAKLARGAAVAASNYPTQGYYKVRHHSEVGWISADALKFPLHDREEEDKESLTGKAVPIGDELDR